MFFCFKNYFKFFKKNHGEKIAYISNFLLLEISIGFYQGMTAVRIKIIVSNHHRLVLEYTYVHHRIFHQIDISSRDCMRQSQTASRGVKYM